AHALDHGGGAGVAHGEALADDAPQVDLASGGAVEDDVSGDDVVLGDEVGVGVLGWAHDDPTARQPLADVVVGVAGESQGHAPGDERPEAVAGGAGEVDHDGVV